MMWEEFWTSWLAFWLLAGPILLIYVHVVFSLYLSRRHLPAMMHALRNSRYIYIWGAGLRNQGWFGGIVLINKIVAMVVWPRAHIRIGDLDPVDSENFPPYLKKLLQIDAGMLVTSAILVVVGAVLIKFK